LTVPATIAQKILARASGKQNVEPGEIVWADVDLAMVQDLSGPRRLWPLLKELGATVWDPDKIMIVTDHTTPPSTVDDAEILQITRQFAREFGIRKFHDMEGICHIVGIERGYIEPGMLYVGADSHSTTAGVLGALAIPVGITEMLAVWVTGQIWLRVPETIVLECRGALPMSVMAKDIVLWTIARLDPAFTNYKVVEFRGEGLRDLPLDERIVLTNMAAEMGAKTGIVAPDSMVAAHLERFGKTADLGLYSDPDAELAQVLICQVDQLEPLVAMPPSPSNVVPVSEVPATRIDQAYIGACTGAKLYDLEQAARVVRGKHVAPDVRFIIAPSSTEVFRQAVASGAVADLVNAGAIVVSTGCGACAGLGTGVLAPDEVCISSTNRNFPGRMGARRARVYLANPAVVAASAVVGHIADPREL
jgi:3-isopropylmalate/(R)-2-methylmalate dehydratase large subunit